MVGWSLGGWGGGGSLGRGKAGLPQLTPSEQDEARKLQAKQMPPQIQLTLEMMRVLVMLY